MLPTCCTPCIYFNCHFQFIYLFILPILGVTKLCSHIKKGSHEKQFEKPWVYGTNHLNILNLNKIVCVVKHCRSARRLDMTAEPNTGRPNEIPHLNNRPLNVNNPAKCSKKITLLVTDLNTLKINLAVMGSTTCSEKRHVLLKN